MKKLSLLFFTALTMLNCKKTAEKTENSNLQEVVTEEKKENSLKMGNYLFEDGKKNLITLVITENGNEIKGFLTYKLAEKDENFGKLTGKLTDGILLGKYTFKSEGKESTREVAFKVEGDTLIEGYGDMNEDGTTFKDVTKLNFTSKMPIVKTDGVFE